MINMKITKATVKKAIKELGFNVEDFVIEGGGSAPRIETALIKDGRAMEKGNKQVRKVAKHLAKQGASYYGFTTGYNAVHYKFEQMSYSTRLAFDNID
jgi:hypothetical protein